MSDVSDPFEWSAAEQYERGREVSMNNDDWLKPLTDEQRKQLASANGMKDVVAAILRLNMNQPMRWKVMIFHEYGQIEVEVETEANQVRPDIAAVNLAIQQYDLEWRRQLHQDAPSVLFCEIARV